MLYRCYNLLIMKISHTKNQISFKKTLVANCSVIKKDNTKVPCLIYGLNQQDDSDYFEKIPNKTDWNSARYLCYLEDDLAELDEKPDRKIYVLESENGECLGYSEVLYDDKTNEILFLETVPTQNFSNREKSSFKYIGETLLSFIVKQSKQQKARSVELQATVASTNFYKNKCFFKSPKKELDPLYLKKKDFSKLISQNEKHTKSTIELVG